MGSLPVISRVITPIRKVKQPKLPIYKAVYRGELAPFITSRDPPCRFLSISHILPPGNLTWQWENRPWMKMYILLKMVVLHWHVSFRGRKIIVEVGKLWVLGKGLVKIENSIRGFYWNIAGWEKSPSGKPVYIFLLLQKTPSLHER